MDKLLFANIDTNGTDGECWCRYDESLSKGKIDEKAENLGMQYDCYRASKVSDNDNYAISYNQNLKAIVLTQKGSTRSSGFILVASGAELIESNHAAGYIGSKKPKWMPVGVKLTHKAVESSLNDVTWLKNTAAKRVNAAYIREKLIPLVFYLLAYKKNVDEKRLVFICDTIEELQEMEGLLKLALMALPRSLANQYSFNTNATAKQLDFSDVSCITGKAFEKCSESIKSAINQVKYPLPSIDESIISRSSFCQYLFEDGIVPKEIDPSISSVEELERAVSDIRLSNYCKNRIPRDEVEKAFRLYDAAHKDYIDAHPEIAKAFAQLAYDVLFSRSFSQGCDIQLLQRLKSFISINSNYNDTIVTLSANELINELAQEDERAAIQHLSTLSSFTIEDIGISNEQKAAIVDLLSGRASNFDRLLPIFAEYIEGLDRKGFESIMSLSLDSENAAWQRIIADKVIRLDSGSGGLDIYLTIRGTSAKLWLFKAIVSAMSLQTIEDTNSWVIFKDKLNKASCNEEITVLVASFATLFEELLNTIGFYNNADAALASIGHKQLELIFTAAEKFEFITNKFNTQRSKIILLTKRDNALATLRYKALIPLRGKKQVKSSEKIIKKAMLNHVATNTPVLLFLFLMLQMAAIIFAFYFTADFAIWEILGSLSGTLTAASIRILFIGIPLLICLAIYISVIMHGRQYETRVVAIRSFSISTLSVLLPIAVFLLTTGIIFH